MTDLRFEACLPIILKWEGGNDDDPNDHGGRTSRGITQREYDKWRAKWGKATSDVWGATTQEIKDIYYGGYWLPRCPHLRPGVDLMYFNMAVNAGPGRAEQELLASIGGTDAQTVDRMYSAGSAFYHGLGQFSRYGTGWMNRLNDIHTKAKHMVTTQPQEKKMSDPGNIPGTVAATTTTTTTTTKPMTVQGLPSFADIEKFVEGADKVLPIIGQFFPPALVIHTEIIPLLESGLNLAAGVQAGQPLDFAKIYALFQQAMTALQNIQAALKPKA